MPLITTQSAKGYGFSNFVSAGGSFADASFESIAKWRATSNTSAPINLASIPSTYKHLQLRILYRDQSGTGGTDGGAVEGYYYFNNDTTAANYSLQVVKGNGGAADATGAGYATYGDGLAAFLGFRSNYGGSAFGITIIDLLDYQNSNKYKTIRSFSGAAGGSVGGVRVTAGTWRSTATVNRMDFYGNQGGFATGTVFALYGIKG